MDRVTADSGASPSFGSEQVAFDGFPTERRIGTLAHDFAPMQQAIDLAGLYAGLARALRRAVAADGCLISVLNEDGTVLRDVAGSVAPPAKLNVVAEEYLVSDYPVTKSVLDTGKVVEISINDAAADERERAFLAELGFQRCLISSLKVTEGTIGTIEVYRTSDKPFRQDDPEQIDVVAAFAASSYSRIQLATKLESQYTATIEALTSALEARDPYTQAHTSRIRDIAVGMAVAMQVPEEIRRSVHFGALLHDVGKIGVSDSILQKAGPLTDEEWEAMRQHPVIGERMLEKVEFLRPALGVVRHHHERWDGKGYPDGLAKNEIPVGARIVAVCDAYDAMTSDRPYRKAMSPDQACEELLAHAGTQHDPLCTSLLVDVISKVGEGQIEKRFVRYSA